MPPNQPRGNTRGNKRAAPAAMPPALAGLQEAWSEVKELDKALYEAMNSAGQNARREATEQRLTVPSPHARDLMTEVSVLAPRVAAALHKLGSYAAWLGDADEDSRYDSTFPYGDDTVDSAEESEPAADDAPRPTSAPALKTTVSSSAWDPEEELADFARAVRAIPKVADADDATIEAAMELWRGGVHLRGTPIRFVGHPGFVGALTQGFHEDRHGIETPDPVSPDSNVWWHKLIWHGDGGEIPSLTQNAIKTVSFCDHRAPLVEGQHDVTETDVNMQYPAAARSAKLGVGDPELFGDDGKGVPQPILRAVISKELPGYFRLAKTPDLSQMPITVRGPFSSEFGGKDLRAGCFLSGPLYRYLRKEHDLDLQVDWALIFRKTSQRLSKWAEIFTGARMDFALKAAQGVRGAAEAEAVVKAVYTSFLGGMTRSQDYNPLASLRPDWWDTYVPVAGANLLRRIDSALESGWSPLGAMKDSIWWAADKAPVQPPGLEFKAQPGKFKLARWCPVTADLIEAHATGQPASLRDAVIRGDKKRLKEESA